MAYAEHLDRRDVVFEDGASRTFKREGFSLVQVELPVEEAAALGSTLLGSKVAGGSGRTRVAKKKPVKARPAAEPLTFAHQIELFREAFPRGFADASFGAQERGAETIGKAAATTLAKELLSRDRLEALVAAGDYAQVFEAVKSVVRATRNMLHPRSETLDFEATPETAHEAFARALVGLLYGEGPYEVRFEAFVAALATKRPYWTLTTLFPALLHPEAYAFAKPLLEQQQARILGMEVPPAGRPTHAGYLVYAAVVEGVRDRLVAAGLKPSDLLDVYSFMRKTLSTKPTKASAD